MAVRILDNPFSPRPSYGPLCIRCSVVVLFLVAISGATLGAWLSLMPLFLLLLISRGQRIVFSSNLAGLPVLTAESGVSDGDNDLPPVSIVAPARNQVEEVEAAARSLCVLDYPEYHAVIVDDHSTDGTTEILCRVVHGAGHVTLLRDPEHQEGWLGKANAIDQGLRETDPGHPWLLFTDANVVFHPKVLRRAMAVAQAGSLDFLACVPWIDNRSAVEALTVPLFWRVLILGAQPDKLNAPQQQAIGTGPFMLIRRSLYETMGGHAAVRNQQPEDTLLAVLAREHGGKLGLAWTPGMLRKRLYRGYGALRERAVLKMRTVADDGIAYQLNGLLQGLLLEVLPLPLALSAILHQWAGGHLSFPLTACAALALLIYVSRSRAFAEYRAIAHIPHGIPWLHPLGATLRAYLQSCAIAAGLLRRNMTWRGRPYHNPRMDKGQ